MANTARKLTHLLLLMLSIMPNIDASRPKTTKYSTCSIEQPPPPARQLQSFTNGTGTYPRMAREFVDTHNAIRHAVGQRPLTWDRRLALHARRWAEQRRDDCQLLHSGKNKYGENMFWGSGWDWKASDAVRLWVDEYLNYDYAHNVCAHGKICGHFTQMVWNETVRIGCGRAECFGGGVIIACNYYPPGNYVGEKPF